jgi:hypothetical protein
LDKYHTKAVQAQQDGSSFATIKDSLTQPTPQDYLANVVIVPDTHSTSSNPDWPPPLLVTSSSSSSSASNKHTNSGGIVVVSPNVKMGSNDEQKKKYIPQTSTPPPQTGSTASPLLTKVNIQQKVELPLLNQPAVNTMSEQVQPQPVVMQPAGSTSPRPQPQPQQTVASAVSKQPPTLTQPVTITTPKQPVLQVVKPPSPPNPIISSKPIIMSKQSPLNSAKRLQVIIDKPKCNVLSIKTQNRILVYGMQVYIYVLSCYCCTQRRDIE